MVLYDSTTELDIEKFDLYNQYRDQVCFLKVDKKLFNIVITPDSWQDLATIVKSENIKALNEWFLKEAPDVYGVDKEFLFTDNLLNILIDKLKDKFN